MSGQYDDIIHLPHHVSKTRPQMSMTDRAAQFSPFSALTGYDETIHETARLTDKEIIMTDEALSILNLKFNVLLDKLSEKPEISITYFEPDTKKSGGEYVTVNGVIKKIDELQRILILTDQRKIPMNNILNIDSDIFEQ